MGDVDIVIIDDEPSQSSTARQGSSPLRVGLEQRRRLNREQSAASREILRGVTIDLTDLTGESSPSSTRKGKIRERKREHSDSEEPSKWMECIICLDPIKQPSSTKCGHIFCGACIKKWLEGHNGCPSCRKKVLVKDLRPIFLPQSTVDIKSLVQP